MADRSSLPSFLNGDDLLAASDVSTSWTRPVEWSSSTTSNLYWVPVAPLAFEPSTSSLQLNVNQLQQRAQQPPWIQYIRHANVFVLLPAGHQPVLLPDDGAVTFSISIATISALANGFGWLQQHLGRASWTGIGRRPSNTRERGQH